MTRTQFGGAAADRRRLQHVDDAARRGAGARGTLRFQGKRESRMGAVCVVGAGFKTAIFCDIVARFYTPGPAGATATSAAGRARRRRPAAARPADGEGRRRSGSRRTASRSTSAPFGR